jgi:hypothetical protein
MDTRLLLIVLSIAAVATIAAVSLASTTNAVSHEEGSSNMTHNENATMTEEHEESMNSTVVRDSLFIRGPVTLAPQDFLHLYDTTPHMIMNGHIAMRTSCDADTEPNLQILVGQAPDLKPAELEYVAELSTPGELCIYHADLHSAHGDHEGTAEGSVITDIALFNPNDVPARLPWQGGSVVIGVNEIMPLEGDHHGEEEEHEEDEEHMEEEE